MSKVKGKEQLCSCKEKYFKSKQGFMGRTLFDRYDAIENAVNRYIDKKYRHFLAQPIINGDSIIWFTKPYHETPRHLSKLQGDEYEKYNQIKNETLNHYRSIITALQQQDKTSEAECLESAIKYVNDDFVYCFNDKTVLGIWGMQLRDEVREPIGTIVKDIFSPVKVPQSPIGYDTEASTTSYDPEPIPPAPNPINPFKVRFNAGEGGVIYGNSELIKHLGEIINSDEVPRVEPNKDYEFVCWDKNPINYCVTNNAEFTAQYRKIQPSIPPVTPPPSRFGNWLRGLFSSKNFKRLLWLLLLLLLLLLLQWLFRNFIEHQATPIPYPISQKPWLKNDPNVDRGGIYNPGDPYEAKPTPPEYRDVLPPEEGVLPPIDSTKVIRNPQNPVIIANRLNILMENETKSILDLAKRFKEKYPDEKYKVVYYDNVVKRMQIEVPDQERSTLKEEIPTKFNPEYTLFVFDETLFEQTYDPNDPVFRDHDKSKYLRTVRASQAWDYTLGSPRLTIAIIDNGFCLKHPELKSKVVMPYNVWTHSKEISVRQIDHGTHVAGTALAIINNNDGICGIAPGCAFMPVQVSNNQNIMTTTSVLDGVLYALYQGADVINISLGTLLTGTPTEVVQRELQDNHFKEEERLWNEVMKISSKHNAIIVTAAGNNSMLAGVDPMKRPKNFIVVSAIDTCNTEYHKACFSNYGDRSTISAPGVDIYSTVGNNDYKVMYGTSMAAPIVSGAIALMKSLNENITTEQIICILRNTGLPANGKIGNLIQIDSALEKIKSGEFVNCNDSIPSTITTGDVQVLLNWNNYNDLDLYVIDPSNDTVYYRKKQVNSGGLLEIDMNAGSKKSQTPIENIYWRSGSAPKGTYKVLLGFYSQKESSINDTPYRVVAKYGVKTDEYPGTIKKEDGLIQVCSFTLRNDNNRNVRGIRNPNIPVAPPIDNRRDESRARATATSVKQK